MWVSVLFCQIRVFIVLQYLLCHSQRTNIETHDLKTVSNVKFYSASNGGAIFSTCLRYYLLRFIFHAVTFFSETRWHLHFIFRNEMIIFKFITIYYLWIYRFWLIVIICLQYYLLRFMFHKWLNFPKRDDDFQIYSYLLF